MTHVVYVHGVLRYTLCAVLYVVCCAIRSVLHNRWCAALYVVCCAIRGMLRYIYKPISKAATSPQRSWRAREKHPGPARTPVYLADNSLGTSTYTGRVSTHILSDYSDVFLVKHYYILTFSSSLTTSIAPPHPTSSTFPHLSVPVSSPVHMIHFLSTTPAHDTTCPPTPVTLHPLLVACNQPPTTSNPLLVTHPLL